MPESNIGSGGEIIEELGPDTRKWLEGLITNQTALIIAALTSRPASAPASNTGGQRANSPAPSGELPHTLPNYGKAKGQPIVGASMGDLEYYANGCRKSIADKDKARFHDKERAMLAAIEAEIQRQSGPPTRRDDPAPDDQEIAF